jgi:[protein-PII] uridylyltransferase
VALVALGGYGRRELCPLSDLDLLLLHRGRPGINELADGVWYPIWNERVALDHSVRTVREAVRTAENDVRAGLTMLDARLVAGDPTLLDDLRPRLHRSLTKLARRWLRSLEESTDERHRRAGDVAFLLEPDLKEGKGGLRDAAVLGAIGSVLEFIAVDEPTRAARDDLLTIRTELHRIAGRPTDALLLQDQDEIGSRLEIGGGDEVMAVVAAAGRRISWAGDDAWRRTRAWIDGPRRVPSGARSRDLGGGVIRVDDEITFAPGPGATVDLATVLHAAAEAARHRLPFGRAALQQMTAPTTSPLPDPWPASAREDLFVLLASGPGLVAVFETLDHGGVWVRLLPEWAPVQSRPQRNAFHHYTVDRHLIEAVVQAAALMPPVRRPDLLLVAALLHDLGKGYPGDHTDAGVELIDTIGARLGFPDDDVSLLRTLVRLHLLLPDTATRRDLDDPKTIDLVAAEVVTVDTLDLLAALTEADARATGPAAWTSWRAGLTRALVERVRQRLTDGVRAATAPPAAGPVPLDIGITDGTTVIGDGMDATVVADDRRGLFCAVAGVLALHGLDIVGATATTRTDGTAVDAFHVQPTMSSEPRWDLVQRDLRAVLDGTLALEEQLARRRQTYGDQHAQLAARPPEIDVQFLDHVSDTSTVIDVRGPASLGALYRITRQFAELDLDIRHARVTTIGNQAVDSFYLVDGDARPITDPALRRRLTDAIVRDLAAM